MLERPNCSVVGAFCSAMDDRNPKTLRKSPLWLLLAVCRARVWKSSVGLLCGCPRAALAVFFGQRAVLTAGSLAVSRLGREWFGLVSRDEDSLCSYCQRMAFDLSSLPLTVHQVFFWVFRLCTMEQRYSECLCNTSLERLC